MDLIIWIRTASDKYYYFYDKIFHPIVVCLINVLF